MNFLELKEKIKLNAEYLKYCRLTRKQQYKEEHYKIYLELESKLYTRHEKYGYKVKTSDYIADSMRIYHVAYSLLRGRSYEQIETHVRPENELTSNDWKSIEKIIDEVNAENVRNNS